MVARNRAARSLHALLTVGQHEAGAEIALPDAACDDTGQAFVAVGQVDHQNLILTQIGLFDKADSLGGSLCCQVFPAVIQGFQIPS